MESKKIVVLVNDNSGDRERAESTSNEQEFVPYRSQGPNGVSEIKKSIISNSWKMIEVSEELLQESLSDLTSSLGNILGSIQRVESTRLSSVEVGLEISAEGGVALIGSASAGVKAAITLKFDLSD